MGESDHVKYDPLLIQQSADRLYAEAAKLIVQSSVVATLLGATAGFVIAVISHEPRQTTMLVALCAAIGGLMGYMRGREKAFVLRLQAQQALCQLYTERNTRSVAVSISQRHAAAASMAQTAGAEA